MTCQTSHVQRSEGCRRFLGAVSEEEINNRVCPFTSVSRCGLQKRDRFEVVTFSREDINENSYAVLNDPLKFMEGLRQTSARRSAGTSLLERFAGYIQQSAVL